MSKQPIKRDRFTQAYELRKAIYKFVKNRPQGCLTDEIFTAMPSMKVETVRKAVYAMRDHGSLLVELSTARIGTVYIGPKPVKTAREAIEQIKTAGRATSGKQKPETHGNCIDNLTNPTTVRGAKTIHLGSRRNHPVKCSGGGQGAVRSRVYVGSSAGMI